MLNARGMSTADNALYTKSVNCKVSFIITTKVTHGYLDEYTCMVGFYC